MYITCNLSKKWPDKCEIVDVSTEFTRHYNRILRDICTANYFVLYCSWFVLFCFFPIFSVELSCPYLHSTTFSYLRPTFYSSSLAISTGFIRRSVFFFLECNHSNLLSFSRTFLHFTDFRHDVMSKLFWVENKVILEKCSVCKQPNRLGNSTELNSGEEFLARRCDFTTTWNLWSLSL